MTNDKLQMFNDKKLKVTKIMTLEEGARRVVLPLVSARVQAGFPSPADDFIDDRLDLNALLVKHPAATHFVQVEGDSMIEAGIHSGDILIVDRALEPADKKVVIAIVDGELTVKRVALQRGKLFLMPENAAFAPIEVREEADFKIWGVVTFVIHSVNGAK